MSGISSVVVVDDGKLGRVVAILRELGVEAERVDVAKVRGELEKPRDLIVMTWDPFRKMPKWRDNADGAEPTRVCFHSQDFLPLRQRLRDLDFHYLVQSALDNDSLRAFFQGLLHRGEERRTERRLQLGGEGMLQIGNVKECVKLGDLSTSGCRVVTDRAIPVDEAVTVVLPKGLGGDAPLEIPGRVLRSSEADLRPTGPSHAVVVRFEGHSEAVRAQLGRILAGEQIGTRATPLQARPAPGPPPRAADAAPQAEPPPEMPPQPTPSEPRPTERRGGERHRYGSKVELLDLANAAPALGCDLSMTGIRLSGAPAMEVGTRLTLALYGTARRGEPVVIDATVARVDGSDMGLYFCVMNEAQRRDIEGLIGASSAVESLRGDPGAERRVISRVLPRSAA